MSPMVRAMLATSKVTMLFLGRNHHPAAMMLPTVGYSRQARALVFLALEGAEELWACS